MTHTLSHFLGDWLPRIEDEMRRVLANDDDAVTAHYGMMRYHLGWADAQLQPEVTPAGKRLRPIICLLACLETGGAPEDALPAAAAIELLHNFSLIHDDVEDGDEVRRHRPTVWKLWGVPQAINVGDGMFALAYAALQGIENEAIPTSTALTIFGLFTRMCQALTEGQHMDMSFETRTDVTVAEYMRMIRGKTGALIGASAAIGALIGGATSGQAQALHEFGEALGLAFQIQDDILGIWGDPAVTGKAAGNDILRRKKSLPLLHSLNHASVGKQMESLLADPTFGAERLEEALVLLQQAGTRGFAETAMRHEHDRSLDALSEALGDRFKESPLLALAESLLHRTA